MATEFVCKIKKSSGEDYDSISAWESACQSDLTSAATKVFSFTGLTGTMTDGSTVTGLTSGATGTCRHASATQIMISNITGTFQSGEVVYRTLSVNFVTISDAGDSVDVVGEGYADDGNMGQFEINGFTTDSTHRVILTGRQAKHAGSYGTGATVTRSADFGSTGLINDDNVIFEWFSANNTNATGNNCIVVSNSNVVVRNCLLKCSSDGTAVVDDTNSVNEYYRNMFFLEGGGGISIGSFGVSKALVYNNSFYGNGSGGTGLRVSSGSSTGTYKNNVAANWSTDFNIGSGTAQYNASEDSSATGTGSITGISIADTFVNAAGGDLHLKSGASCIDAGTNLGSPYDIDIDNTTVTGTWDIGADEFVSAGGGGQAVRSMHQFRQRRVLV